jgi:hypothetical protein
MKYKNTKTGKIFDIAKSGNQFDAQQVGGADKGHIDYRIKGSSMDVKNMFSVPEKESGLGCLLLFLAVKDAIAQKCGLVEISNAAFDDNRGFYFKMGCRADPDVLSAIQSSDDLTDEERQKLEKLCPIGGAAMTVLNASHASMFKRWEPQ